MQVTDRELFSTAPPEAIERLAKIEGTSNFLSMLAGIEAGPDTTQDMAALAFSRRGDVVPEMLEAYVARSAMFKIPLMSIVFRAVCRECHPKPKDYPWVQGTIADAFGIVRTGECKPLGQRAKWFRVDISAYSAMRKLAHGVFLGILDRAEQEWKTARFSKSRATGKRHSVDVERAAEFGRAIGNYYAPPLPVDSDGERVGFDTRGIGIKDTLGWNDRNAEPGPVTITLVQPTDSAHVKTDVGTSEP
jgi:hypothetical protein